MEATALLRIFYVVFFALLGGGGTAGHLLKGFGLYQLAKNQGNPHPYLAFIPYGNLYLEGELAGALSLGKKTIKNTGLWMLLVPLIGGAALGVGYVIFIVVMVLAALVPQFVDGSYMAFMFGPMLMGCFLFSAAALAYSACQYALQGLVRFRISHRYAPSVNMAVLHTVLGIAIPLYTPIYYFVIRNKTTIAE